MPHSYYRNGKLTQKDILGLLRIGKYSVDFETGDIYGQGGKLLKSQTGNSEPYLYINLYDTGKRIAIVVHKLVWMAGTMSTVPRNFEIHHRDLDPTNNSFNNLICVHKIDHAKLHSEYIEDDETPF